MVLCEKGRVAGFKESVELEVDGSIEVVVDVVILCDKLFMLLDTAVRVLMLLDITVIVDEAGTLGRGEGDAPDIACGVILADVGQVGSSTDCTVAIAWGDNGFPSKMLGRADPVLLEEGPGVRKVFLWGQTCWDKQGDCLDACIYCLHF